MLKLLYVIVLTVGDLNGFAQKLQVFLRLILSFSSSVNSSSISFIDFIVAVARRGRDIVIQYNVSIIY